MYKRIECATSSEADSDVLIGFITRPAGATGEVFARAAARPECTGAAGEITTAEAGDRRLVLVGLGEGEALDAEGAQAAGGHLVAALHRMAVGRAHLHHLLPVTDALAGGAAAGRAVGEGIGLGSFTYDEFRQRPRDARKPGTLTITCDDGGFAEGIAAGLAAAESANFARRLAAAPPNVATPAFLAEQARRLAADAGLACTIYEGEELERRRFVGLLNVGRASEHKPCMIQLIYTPEGAAADPPSPTILLVGKTITFDSGGLSLKIHDTMRHMKYDKCGGTAVLGAMHAVARSRPPCRVVALLPAAENAISDVAYRVDDIIRYPNGLSVEVTNTDFEGRLVMADALLHGAASFRPDAIIDLGTLTGGIITALGQRTAGLFCDDAELRGRLERAAALTDERIWPMPLLPDHHAAIESHHADVVNNIIGREAEPCVCAAFLSRFVPPGVPWAHLDIAGPVHVTTATPPYSPGPTGFGARLLAEVIRQW